MVASVAELTPMALIDSCKVLEGLVAVIKNTADNNVRAIL